MGDPKPIRRSERTVHPIRAEEKPAEAEQGRGGRVREVRAGQEPPRNQEYEGGGAAVIEVEFPPIVTHVVRTLGPLGPGVGVRQPQEARIERHVQVKMAFDERGGEQAVITRRRSTR